MNPSRKKQKYKVKFIDELVNATKHRIPFVVLTETHLKDTVLDAEVSISNYNINRADRITRKNGGTLIYTHQDIVINQKEVYSDSKCECVMLKNNDTNFILISVYKPPSAIDLASSFKKCIDSMSAFIDKYDSKSTLLVMGDFNLPIIDWSTSEIKHARSLDDKKCAEVLLNFVDDRLLIQQVNETTRCDKSTLDLVFTNNEEWIHEINVEKTKISDHDFVNVTLSNVFQNIPSDNTHYIPEHPIDKLNLHKANWSNIRNDLNQVKWEEILNSENTVDSMTKILETEIINISTKHTPKRKTRDPNAKSAYIPRDRLAMIRRRKRLKSKINFEKYVR